MMSGGLVKWEELQTILHGQNEVCQCCMGVRMMPTGEELEERITNIIDKSREDIRKAMLSLEIKQMDEELEKTKAVMRE